MAYCSSRWYCRTCHVGDHSEIHQLSGHCWSYKACPWEQGYETQRDPPLDRSAWDDHAQCKGFKLKGKVGPVVCKGKPLQEGRGKAKKPGNGQGDQQEQILADIKAGKSRGYIFETYAGYCQRYHAWVDKQITQFAPQRSWKPAVWWLWGGPGTYKSRAANGVLPTSTFIKQSSCKWWDGYNAEEVVILDDLRKGDFFFHQLLRVLDRYKLMVEVKGGSVPMVAKLIIVTCSMPPEQLWARIGDTENEDVGQLLRRIDRVVQFPLDRPLGQMVNQMRHALCAVRASIEAGPGDDAIEAWDGLAAPGDTAALAPVDETQAPPRKRSRKEPLFENPDVADGPRVTWAVEEGEEQPSVGVESAHMVPHAPYHRIGDRIYTFV